MLGSCWYYLACSLTKHSVGELTQGSLREGGREGGRWGLSTRGFEELV
jgi:hypothetical protein